MNANTTVDFPPRILVVDDEQRIRNGCREVLASEGYSVHLAGKGSEALEMIADQHFDILLLDLMMPGISGFDVLTEVRSRHPDTVVIVITGYATIEHSIKAMKSGAFDFIPKPFAPDHLRVVVSKAIDYTRALKDITHEKSRLRILINHLGEGVMATDNVKQIVFANPSFQKLTGCELSDITGKKISEITHNDQIEKLIDKALAIPSDQFAELTDEIENGEGGDAAVITIRCVPFRDRMNRNIGTVTVLRDITALKKMDQMKSEFVSMVSHEIRSPMNSVLSQLKVVLDGLAGDVTPKQKEILERASERILALSNLTFELLDLAKIESGMVSQEREKLNVADLVTKQVGLYSAPAAEKKIDLIMEPADPIPDIIANRHNVEEIISNLVSNAIRYTPSEGRVTVSLSADEVSVCIAVSDTGFGIAPEDLKRIFDRFYRVKNAQTRHITGTGLGLAIVKKIMEAHNGAIRVESQVGKGSTFKAFFPLPKS